MKKKAKKSSAKKTKLDPLEGLNLGPCHHTDPMDRVGDEAPHCPACLRAKILKQKRALVRIVQYCTRATNAGSMSTRDLFEVLEAVDEIN